MYILLELECSHLDKDLPVLVENRTYSLPGVQNTKAWLMTTAESYGLALAQKEGHEMREIGRG